MKKTKLILTSHYFKLTMNIVMDADKAERLMSKECPMRWINHDIDRIADGFAPHYITASQARRIRTFFGVDNGEFFDSIRVVGK